MIGYKCIWFLHWFQSASSLLRSSLFDPEDVVRHTAFDIYSRHPQRKQLTKEQENMILEYVVFSWRQKYVQNIVEYKVVELRMIRVKQLLVNWK